MGTRTASLEAVRVPERRAIRNKSGKGTCTSGTCPRGYFRAYGRRRRISGWATMLKYSHLRNIPAGSVVLILKKWEFMAFTAVLVFKKIC
jgi:hypothetical protein